MRCDGNIVVNKDSLMITLHTSGDYNFPHQVPMKTRLNILNYEVLVRKAIWTNGGSYKHYFILNKNRKWGVKLANFIYFFTKKIRAMKSF